MMEGNSNLTRDAATVLAERGTSPVDNGKCTQLYIIYIHIYTHIASYYNPMYCNLHVANHAAPICDNLIIT